MKLAEFVRSLKPQDAAIGIGLVELIRRADHRGAIERGDWLAAVRAAYARAGTGTHEGAMGESDAPEELDRYVEEHILERLASEQLVVLEPPGEGWERARVEPGLWTDVCLDRESILADLTGVVDNLLAERSRTHTERMLPGSGIVPGGSTLSARGLVKVYRKRRAVADVNLEVAQGEIVGLLGPNGAGKTTTFYMIVGLIGPDAGRVFLDQAELTRTPMYKRARAGIGYLAQEPSIFRKLTVEQNILAILETMPLPRAEKRARLERLLDELGIKHLRKAKAYSLSGGERRRLEITRALVSDPKFMLLDEPFAGVDPIAVHDIQQIVAELRHRGIGVIITDHNVEQTLDIVDRAYIMYDGKVRVSGSVQELVWNEEVAEIYFGPTLTARMRQRYPRPEMVA